MVKIIIGLMGASAQSGSSSLSSPSQLRPVLQMLKRHNVRELDTARAYNRGRNEELLGDIPEANDEFSIATKVAGFSKGSLTFPKVIDGCNASLAALKQEKIDLFYFHGPDRQTPLEESCKAINQLYQEGKITTFGISNFNAEEVQEMHSHCTKNGWVLPTVYQGGYNGLGRTGETTLFPVLRKLGIAFYAYSPLAGGYFSKPTAQLRTPAAGSRMDQMKQFANMYVNDVTLEMHDRLTAVCEKEGLTVKEAALRWLMHHSARGDHDGVILGGSSAEQIEENVRACEGGVLPQGVVDCFEMVWTQLQEAGKALPASL